MSHLIVNERHRTLQRISSGLMLILLCLLISPVEFAIAQKGAMVVPPPSDSASLDETLSWLKKELERVGKHTYTFPLKMFGVREQVDHVRTKGCTFRLQSTVERPRSNFQRLREVSDLREATGAEVQSREEWEVDLADVDPLSVEVGTRHAEGGSVFFQTRGRQELIKIRYNAGKWYRTNVRVLKVHDKDALEAVHVAFRQAVKRCQAM